MHLHATATVKLMCLRFFCFNNRVLIISEFDGLSSSSLFEKAIKCHKVGLCLGMPGVHVFLELAVVWRHLALVVQLQSCCPWGGALAARAWTTEISWDSAVNRIFWLLNAGTAVHYLNAVYQHLHDTKAAQVINFLAFLGLSASESSIQGYATTMTHSHLLRTWPENNNCHLLPRYKSIDLSILGYDRICRNEPVLERGIYWFGDRWWFGRDQQAPREKDLHWHRFKWHEATVNKIVMIFHSWFWMIPICVLERSCSWQMRFSKSTWTWGSWFRIASECHWSTRSTIQSWNIWQPGAFVLKQMPLRLGWGVFVQCPTKVDDGQWCVTMLWRCLWLKLRGLPTTKMEAGFIAACRLLSKLQPDYFHQSIWFQSRTIPQNLPCC